MEINACKLFLHECIEKSELNYHQLVGNLQ